MTRSPADTPPESTVPVTTVPAPASVNERSTASRKRSESFRPHCTRGIEQPITQSIDAVTGDGRDRNDFSVLQARAL